MTTKKTYEFAPPNPSKPNPKPLEKLMQELLDDVAEIVQAPEREPFKEFFEPPPGGEPGDGFGGE